MPQINLNTFGAMVAGVWAALKLKKEYDDYAAVSTEDAAEGGRIRLPATPAENVEGEDGVSLLASGSRRRAKNKPTGCCVCCGLDCSLFWKAFGIVAGLWLIYGIFSGFKWAFSSKPTGLENMPAFGESLTCQSTDYYYKDAPEGFPFTVRVNDTYHDHSIKLQGSGVGTLTVTNAPLGAKDVTYKIILRGSDKDTVDAADFDIEEPDTGKGYALLFKTPRIPLAEASSNCIRYDVEMAVPSSVKELNIHAKSILQVKFAEDAQFDLKKLSIVLFKLEDLNMILPSPKVFADEVTLEVYRGWIVGETTVSGSTHVLTQRSNGVMSLKVHPAPPSDPLHPEPVKLRTTTGSGRTDIFYVANPTKRPIDSKHFSSQGGDVYLDYKKSRFDGKISMGAKNYMMTGAKPIRSMHEGGSNGLRRAEDGSWTDYVGSIDGDDRMEVLSSGWVGLYF